MANEEVLRLRTTIVTDQSLAQLRALQREIGAVQQRSGASAKVVTTEFTKMTLAVRALGTEVTKAVPALGGLGLGAAGIGLAFGAVIRTMNDVSSRVVGLKNLSADIGLSIKQIRGFQAAAAEAGSTPEEAASALQTFVKNTEDFKRRIGAVREELYAHRAGDLVEAITGAKDPQAAIDTAFARLRRMIQQGRLADAKDLSRLMFGSSDVLHYMDEVAAAQARQRDLTKEQIDQLIAYHKQMKQLGDAWDAFVMKMGSGLAPKLMQDFKDIEAILKLADKIGQQFGLAPGEDPIAKFSDHLLRGKGSNLPPSQQRGPRTPAESLAMGMSPISFGGFGGGGAQLSEGSRMVKDGVFAALVDFKSYVEGGSGAGGGFTNASFGGSAGAAAGRGMGGAAGFGGGGYTNLTPGTGGGTAGAGGEDGGGVVPRTMGRMPGGGGRGGGTGPAGDDAQADTSDTSKTGNEYLRSQRARIKAELDADPELRKRFAAIISLENPGAGTAVAESAMNRAAMTGRSLRSILQGGSKSFYGPARKGLVEPRAASMSAKEFAARNAQINEALGGSNQTKGNTDQGSAGDPNYWKGGVGVNINRERFNDWGGYRGVEYSREWRLQQQRQVSAAAAQTTARMDEQIAPPAMTAKGTVNLTVNSNGTAAKTSSNADGLWQSTTVQNYKQMQRTEAPTFAERFSGAEQ